MRSHGGDRTGVELSCWAWAVHESIMTLPMHLGYGLERLQDRPKTPGV